MKMIAARTYIIEHTFACVNGETGYGLGCCRRGTGSAAQDRADHAENILLVDLAQVLFGVATSE